MRRHALTFSWAGLACAVVVCIATATSARADDGLGWRRTSPRVSFTRDGDGLDLLVPRGRARGARTAAIAVVPAGRYRASVELEVERAVPRGAFLRIALYGASDGRGRQRLVLDSALATGDGRREVAFRAPPWAHAARLRILARPDRRTGVSATDLTFAGDLTPPEVLLRDDD